MLYDKDAPFTQIGEISVIDPTQLTCSSEFAHTVSTYMEQQQKLIDEGLNNNGLLFNYIKHLRAKVKADAKAFQIMGFLDAPNININSCELNLVEAPPITL